MTHPTPTQVKFVYENEVLYGIAYGDEVICSCCGGVFEIEDIVIVEKLPWEDFSSAIRD